MIMAKKKPETKVEETTEQKIPEGYAEVTPEMLAELAGGGMQTVMSIGLAEGLYLEDLRDRLFYLDGMVDSNLLHSVTMQIYKINGIDCSMPEEKRTPIVLVINSGGGSVFDGIGLMDAIRQSKTPVIAICAGYAMSMAFNIFSVCHLRVAMPNSIFMYHDGYESVDNTATKAADWAAFSPKVDKRISKMIAERSKFTVKKLTKIAPHDNYWLTDKMVEMEIVDAVIGKDIEMEDLFAFMSDMPCDCDNGECDCKKKK